MKNYFLISKKIHLKWLIALISPYTQKKGGINERRMEWWIKCGYNLIILAMKKFVNIAEKKTKWKIKKNENKLKKMNF